MFFTCAPRAGTHVPRRRRRRSQSRRGRRAHVRFMFDADASSTTFTPSSRPKYHIASTSSCSASTFASASRSPVTMLTTPPGTSDVSSTCRSRSRRADAAPTGSRSTCCRWRSPARRARRSRAAATRRARDADDADRLVHRERDAANRHVVHRAVVLVGPRRVGEQPRDATRRPPRASRFDAPVIDVDARRELVAPRVEVLGDVVEDLRAGVPSPSPSPSPRARLRRRCGCPCDCLRRPRRAARPSATRCGASSPSRAAPACRR